MKRKSYIWVLLFVISIVAYFYPLLTANASEWDEWQHKSGVSAHKAWTISFTKSMDIATVNEQNVYVLDAQQNKVDVSFIVSNDGKDLIIEPPSTGYKIGQTYTLYITSNVLTKRQQLLKKPTKMSFTIASNQTDQVKEYNVRPDSANEVQYEGNVEMLSQQQTATMQLLNDEMIQSTSATNTYAVGDIIVFPPSTAYPLGLSKKIVAIEKNAKGYKYKTTKPTAEELVKDIDISQEIPITIDHLVTATGPQLQTAVASLNSKVLPNGVIAWENGEDLELSFNNLKIGREYFLTGGVTLKNPTLLVDLNDESLDLLEDATVVFKSGAEIHASMGARKSGDIHPRFEEKFLISSFYVPIPQFPLVGGNFELYLVIGIEGEIRFEYRKAVNFEIGARWTDGEREKVNNVTLPKEDGEQEPPPLSAVMQMSAKAGVGVEVAVAITSEVKLASISADVGVKSTQSVFNYRNTLCYHGTNSIYIDASIQTETIKRYELKLLGLEKILQSAETCPYVVKLNVTPDKTELAPKESQSIHVEKVHFLGRSDTSLDNITFQSSNPNVVTVDRKGIITVKDDAKEGTANIFVTYKKAGNEITEKVHVTIPALEEEAEVEQPEQNEPNNKPVEEPKPSNKVISIPNPLLEEKIRSTLKIPTAPITESDMAKLERLYIYDVEKDLDLTGLEYAINLESLDIREATKLKNLQAISHLPKLKKLYLYENNMTDLTPLQSITSLESLNVSRNKLTNVKPIASLTNLKELYIAENNIVDISSLHTLSNLEIINAGYNKVQDISVLAQLQNLKVIMLWYNEITNIKALQNLHQLMDLVLEANKVKDVKPLSNLTKLQAINLRQNNVTDISSLSNLTNLMTVVLDDNSISNISVVQHFTKLNTLTLSNNKIQEISPLKNLTELTTLSLANNKIKQLDHLKNATKLQYVHLANNEISTIKPIYHINSIQRLDLENNKVNDITLLFQVEKLKYLNVRGNPVPAIHLHEFDNLPGLYLVR